MYYGLAGITPGSWTVNQADLANMRNEGISGRFAHIDYPDAIAELARSSGVQPGQCILRHILQRAEPTRFNFIWPITYAGYDATQYYLSDKKTTVFDVIVKLTQSCT